MAQKLKVLVVGCGHMGISHAKAYKVLSNDFDIVGLVSRGEATRQSLNQDLGGGFIQYSDYSAALRDTKPDCVCISTYSETHATYAIEAMEQGAHVFLEKPIADTLEDAERVVACAKKYKRILVIGYILHVHPSWQKFTQLAQGLGKPLVMRMNLNQQSFGVNWTTHKKLLQSTSPIVDCGVHYVDVMCRMTQARPVAISSIGARLTQDISETQINYGCLQVKFSDGSVGWYEAGWGPMMSETAFFIKDVIGPKGSVSIVAKKAASDGNSSNIDSHTSTESILLHHSTLKADGSFENKDELIDVKDEPNHDELCLREQKVFLNAIRTNEDLTAHLTSALDSLRIVLAADQSFREGKTIQL